nr:Tn3 family transposase [uncultured Cedecea sp.]
MYPGGQGYQLSALGLVSNVVVLLNRLDMQEVLPHLHLSGEIPEEEHLASLFPLIHGHINMPDPQAS